MLTSADIRSATFSRTRWMEGYAIDEVDAFLERAADAVDGRATLAPLDVVNARFQPTKFRIGYNQGEVDDFLDRVAASL